MECTAIPVPPWQLLIEQLTKELQRPPCVWGFRVFRVFRVFSVFRVLGFRVLRVLGFRGFGVLGFWGLGV